MAGTLGPMAAALALAAFAAGWLGTRSVLTYARRAGIVDRPNDRSLHSAPTPRGGGVAVAVIFCAAALGLAPWAGAARTPLLSIGVAAVLVAGIGWQEDRRGLPIGPRLAVQALAAVLVLAGVGWPAAPDLFGATVPLHAAGAAVALLWLVWMTNLYNFMDGIDGLAGGQAVVAGAVFGVWFAAAGAPALAGVCWALAAASAGFLVWNWPPARIFLGDAGSVTLGLAFGALALTGTTRYDIPWGAFVLALGLFIADATWTLLARAVRGEPWWRPHRSHFYQRAVAAGCSHARVSAVALAAAAVLAGLGTLEAARVGPRWLWAVLGLGLAAGLAAVVRVRERR